MDAPRYHRVRIPVNAARFLSPARERSVFPLAAAQEWLEDVVVVPDAAAVEALVLILERAKVLTEPAASCTLAAAEAVRERLGEHVVLVLCGGNATVGEIAAWRERFGV